MIDSAVLPILLIDDHPLLRAGLRMMLESVLPQATIREAGSIADATREVAERPELVLLDIELPGLNGIDGLAVLKHHWPATRVVILTSHAEADARASALARGADGFLSKSESVDTMIATIHAALRGEPDSRASASVTEVVPHLTPRQCEVLDLLCLGLSNKLIGRRLNLSENTVRGHVQGVLVVLGAVSRAEAVVLARQRGWVR